MRVGDHHAGAAGWQPGELFSQERQFLQDHREIVSGLVRLPEGGTALGSSISGGPDGAAVLLVWAPAQPHSSTATRTGRAFVDELDPGSL